MLNVHLLFVEEHQAGGDCAESRNFSKGRYTVNCIYFSPVRCLIASPHIGAAYKAVVASFSFLYVVYLIASPRMEEADKAVIASSV